MIPTREEIEADWANPRFTPETTALIWLRSMRDEIDRLRADLDRANTEAALARDAMAKATTDTRAKVQNELRSVERALCSADVLIKYAAWSRGAYECHVKNTIETAIDALRDDSATTPYSPPFEGDPKDCAFKTTPAPEREAAIRAWEEDATLHRCGSRFDDDDPRATYLMARSEITAAVALMRSAGDGKALLRELRAWIIDEKWCAPGIVRKIDEMLARPCPEVPETPKIQPSEDREAKIEAWEKEALTVESDEGSFGQGYFILRRSEITEAVALMHSAGDGKALLRELREDLEVYPDGIWTTREMVAKIGLLLARPAPVEQPAPTPDDERRAMIGMARQFRETYYPHSAVMHASGDDGQELLIYTRGEYRNDLVRLIASFGNMTGSAPVEQPAAAVPDHFPDAGKMVPDDTRELVAQLADVAAEFFVAPWCDRAKAIAKQLRGGA